MDDSAARAEWGWQPRFDLPGDGGRYAGGTSTAKLRNELTGGCLCRYAKVEPLFLAKFNQLQQQGVRKGDEKIVSGMCCAPEDGLGPRYRLHGYGGSRVSAHELEFLFGTGAASGRDRGGERGRWKSLAPVPARCALSAARMRRTSSWSGRLGGVPRPRGGDVVQRGVCHDGRGAAAIDFRSDAWWSVMR
jgi:hypothetical protein